MAINDKTRKILWARSGNRCAYCRCELVLDRSTADDSEAVVGDECHIIGQKVDGPRGVASNGRDVIDEYDNLILLCKTHHKLVDDQPVKFTVEFLLLLKTAHETWVKKCLEPLKQEGKQPKILLLDRIETGKQLMAILGGVCSHLPDHEEPQNEQEMELLGGFLQEVQDGIDIWGEVESTDRVRMLDQRFMHTRRQLAGGELGEGAAECPLARHLGHTLPATQPPQRRIHLQPLDQGRHRRQYCVYGRQIGVIATPLDTELVQFSKSPFDCFLANSRFQMMSLNVQSILLALDARRV